MAATALLKFQQGSRVGGDGQALIVEAGTAVTIENSDNTDVASWRIELLYGPPGSTFEQVPDSPTVLAQNAASALPTTVSTPEVGFPGSYRIRLTVWEGAGFTGVFNVDIRNYTVLTAIKGVLPPFQLLPNQIASKPDELNFEGQPWGWSGPNFDHATYGASFERFRLLNAYLLYLDTLAVLAPAPTMLWVNANTGSDSATGEELDPLATLSEARRRIGDLNGVSTIYLDGVPNTQYQTTELGRCRTGRGILNIIGVPKVYLFEDRNVTDVTGRVITFDGAPINDNYYKGWLVELDGTAWPLGCILENTTNTITLARTPSPTPTTLSIFRPGIVLMENTAGFPICGGPNRDWRFDYLSLQNLEFNNGGTTLFTGELEFSGCTAAPGSVMEFRDAYLKVGPAGVGLSMRGEGTSPGALEMSNVRGEYSGHMGSCRMLGCGLDTAELLLSGGALSFASVASYLSLGIFSDWPFDFSAGSSFRVHGGKVSLSADFIPNVGPPELFEYATVYCSSDLTAFIGEDMSTSGNSFDLYGSHVERI